MDNSGYIEEYLMKGKKTTTPIGLKKTTLATTMPKEASSIKVLKAKRM